MEPTEHNFIGQFRNEEVQFFFRHHWIRFFQILFFSALLGILIVVTLTTVGIVITRLAIPLVSSLFGFFAILTGLVYLHVVFLHMINYYFSLVIVTDFRILIIRKTVFMRNDSDVIDLPKVQDIGVAAHGLLPNYLRYGELIITLSQGSMPVVIAGVPHPHTYLERLNRIKRENILRRQERRRGEPENPST